MPDLFRPTTACLALLTFYLSVGAAVAYRDDAPANAVRIANQKFAPASITIRVGEKVTWTNADNRDHKLVAKDGSWKSDNLKHGDTFSHTFDKAGTYDYACEYRPRMKGTVVVK
jgi:plastocyanin